MKINALLDVNLVAHEADDEVAVLLELEAPAALADVTRPQASLQVVLDRSGSMDGAPLEGAKKALIALVRRLEPTDNFGLVAFDDSAQVVVPAGPLTDKEAVIAQIKGVRSGGSTDLSAGYLRGLREIRRVARHGGTVLVVSDGHVNAGIKDVDEFASITSKAYADGIVTSTLGYGRGYDETLLAALARSGNGNHVFADNPDAAGAAIAGEVDGLLNKVVQAVSLTVKFEPAVEFLRLYNDLPAQQIGDGQVMIELGDLYAEEARKVLLKLKVPALASLGLAQHRDPGARVRRAARPGRARRCAPDHRQRRPRRRGRRAGAAPDRALGGALPGGPGRQAPGVRGVRARRLRRGAAADRRDQVAPRDGPWRSPPRRSSREIRGRDRRRRPDGAARPHRRSGGLGR